MDLIISILSIPYGLVVKSPAFRSVDLGSIPGGGTRLKKKNRHDLI